MDSMKQVSREAGCLEQGGRMEVVEAGEEGVR